MSETMRERVAVKIDSCYGYDEPLSESSQTWQSFMGMCADAAITAVIEALAAEAMSRHGELIVHGIPDMFGDIAYDEGMIDGYMVAEFLRAHLDAGRDGEAGG